MSSRPTSRPRAHVAVLVLVVAGILAWLALRERERPTGALEPAHGSSVRDDASQSYAPVATVARREEPIEVARATPATPSALPTQPASDGAASSGPDTLVLTFSRPDFATYEITRGTLRVIDGAGREHVLDVEDAKSATFEHLASGTWTVHATGAGFVHEQQRIEDAPSTHVLDLESDGAAPVRSRLVVWPDGWIRVFVEARDGRPLAALADDLRLDANVLFKRAFGVLASLEAPAHAHAAGVIDRQLATFRRAPIDRGFAYSNGAIGSLEPRDAVPPFWVRLDLHERTLAWQFVGAKVRDVVFRIDAADLDLVLARVAVRVVDATSREPVADVQVAVDAAVGGQPADEHLMVMTNRRAPRRTLASAGTDLDGRVEFSQLVPGTVHLLVDHDGAQHLRQVKLAPGEHKDVGEVLVGRGTSLDVLVVDRAGVPVQAWVKIGAYENGRPAVDCYPPTAPTRTNVDGRARLAMASAVVLVQAMAVPKFEAPGQLFSSGRQTRHMRVAHEEARSRTLVLVLEQSARVQFETRDAAIRSFEVLDDSDLLVARMMPNASARPWFIPGRYRVRAIGQDGVERGSREFTVADAPVTIEF